MEPDAGDGTTNSVTTHNAVPTPTHTPTNTDADSIGDEVLL